MLPVESGYYSAINSYVSYVHDAVLMQPDGSWAVKDVRFGPVRTPGVPPAVVAKVGRNRLCPCGSGKKYKRCHGKPAPVFPLQRPTP